jgi:hypothetical protein
MSEHSSAILTAVCVSRSRSRSAQPEAEQQPPVQGPALPHARRSHQARALRKASSQQLHRVQPATTARPATVNPQAARPALGEITNQQVSAASAATVDSDAEAAMAKAKAKAKAKAAGKAKSAPWSGQEEGAPGPAEFSSQALSTSARQRGAQRELWRTRGAGVQASRAWRNECTDSIAV